MGRGVVKAEASNGVRANTGVGRTSENHLLSVQGKYLTDNNYLLYTEVDGGFIVRLDDDRYIFLPGEVVGGVERKYWGLAAGLTYANPLRFDDRLVGGRLRLGNARITFEPFAGRIRQENLWDRRWDDWVWGTTLGINQSLGPIPNVSSRVTFEQEIEPDHKIAEDDIIYSFSMGPFWDRYIIYSSGKFLLAGEGGHQFKDYGLDEYRVDSGLQIAATQDLGLKLAYIQTDLSSSMDDLFDEDALEGLREQNRCGRAGATYRVAPGVSLSALGDVCENHVAGMAGIQTLYVGAYIMDRASIIDDGHGVGGMVNGRIPAGNSVVFSPYIATLFENDSLISKRENEVLIDTGVRSMITPVGWPVGISAVAGYQRTPLAETGDVAIVGLYIVYGMGSSSPSVPRESGKLAASGEGPDDDIIGKRQRPLTAPAPCVMAGILIVARPYEDSPLMQRDPEGNKKKLRHGYHIKGIDKAVKKLNKKINKKNKRSKKKAPLLEKAECLDCHSYDKLVYNKESRQRTCFGQCHETEKKAEMFEWDRPHPNAQYIPPDTKCEKCHGESFAKRQTISEGKGDITVYPHANEVYSTWMSVWDHKARLNGECLTCHDDWTQYKGRNVSCDPCHKSSKPSSFAAKSPHPDGWEGAGHQMQAKIDNNCSSCHSSRDITRQNECISCHTKRGVLKNGAHSGIGFLWERHGLMGHGKAAQTNGVQTCVSQCHTVLSCSNSSCHTKGANR